VNEPPERPAMADNPGNRPMPPPTQSWQWAFQYQNTSRYRYASAVHTSGPPPRSPRRTR